MKHAGLNLLIKSEAAYVAGFTDGDGYIGISRFIEKKNLSGYSYRAEFKLDSVSKEFLKSLRKLTKDGSYLERAGNSKWNEREMNHLVLTVSGIKRILPKIIPHLKLKKRQAILTLKFANLCRQGERRNPQIAEKLYWQVKYLNRRGRDALCSKAQYIKTHSASRQWLELL